MQICGDLDPDRFAAMWCELTISRGFCLPADPCAYRLSDR